MKLFKLPFLIVSIISMITGLFLFPESEYAKFIVTVLVNVTDFASHMGMGLMFAFFFLFFPVSLLFLGFSFLTLISGRMVFRWSANSKANSLIRTVLKWRNSFHLLGILFVTLGYAIVFRHMEAETIEMTRNAISSVFLMAELFFNLFIFNVGNKILKAAKKENPINSNFTIRTTKDQCWVYSIRNKKTYRTIVELDDDLNFFASSTYSTGESINDW